MWLQHAFNHPKSGKARKVVQKRQKDGRVLEFSLIFSLKCSNKTFLQRRHNNEIIDDRKSLIDMCFAIGKESTALGAHQLPNLPNLFQNNATH